MGLIDRVLGEDGVLLRQYLATVIGPLRAPFGRRSNVPVLVGATARLAMNSTTSNVIFVTVSRADVLLGQAQVIFSNSDTPSTNDFVTLLTGAGVLRFTLRPGEQLSVLNQSALNLPLVVGQETF